MLLMAPIMFFTGLNLTFWSGQFNRQIIDSDSIGYVMAALTFTEAVGATVVGRISDKVGQLTLLWVALFIQSKDYDNLY